MDIFLVIGCVVGFLAIVVGMIVKGANIAVLLNPAAAIIILVGTSAAVMNSFPKNEFLNIPKIFGALFKGEGHEDPKEVINEIIELAQLARREGLLVLEEEANKKGDTFLSRGIGMIVDGGDPDYIREVLETEIEYMEDRHRVGASVFTSAGSSAPTLGVLGAVVGLIGALGNLNDTEKLGHMIAGAFVATLYGIFVGYVLAHPFASRLKRKSHHEISIMKITAEGILSIQAGENPKIIQRKLMCMLPPVVRKEILASEKPNNNG